MSFRGAFREIALFLGRPSSENILFSDTPFDDEQPSLEEIENLAAKIGLEARQVSGLTFAQGSDDYPLMLVFDNGEALPLLESTPDGAVLVSLDSDGAGKPVSLSELLPLRPRLVVSFSVLYLNQNEEAGVGFGAEIEKRHWLATALVPFWRSYAQVAVAALFINLLALASPLFVMNVYDRVLPNEAIATLWVLAIGVFGAVLFDLLLKAVRSALIDYAGRRADLKLSYLLFEKVLHATLASRPASTGEYASRVSQYEFAREFFTSNTLSTIIDCLFVFVFIFVIYLISGWIALIPATAFLAALLIGLVAQGRIGRTVSAATNEAAQKQSLLVEAISAIETVKSLRSERQLLRRWQELSKNAARTSERIKPQSAWAANATQFVQQMVTVAIVLAGAYQFAQGNITSGAIVAAVMLSSRAVAPLGQIAMTLARMRQAMLSLRIVDMIMQQPEDRPASVGFVNREITSGSIAFRGVDFAYPDAEAKVLSDINLTIAAGEKVGIIGRIGSGKTTIGRLLIAIYAPQKGSLLIDGVDIRQYHPATIRSAVAFASQSADLFAGTIKENLLMAKPDATDGELIRVAKLTGVDEFVSRHPRGYDMPVGERGSRLSGGQRQAVAIARLLLRQPKIVFLDEPSSSMDLASERELISRLEPAFDESTTLIIATHRHSMLALVNRLIVIDQGKVVADGPKDAVIRQLQGAMPRKLHAS